MNDKTGNNYHRMMETQISKLIDEGRTGTNAPSLLLHSCCGPCSSAVIAALSSSFKITVFYFNPNIDDHNEYRKRLKEQERLLTLMPTTNPVHFLEGEYLVDEFLTATAPHCHDNEGGVRCTVCYTLRLEKTAKTAKEGKWDFFATTLSVSPMKDEERINTIGSKLAAVYGVGWLWSDFKKKDGYKRSIELSNTYGLYRQDFCGCSHSRRASDRELG